ncbi:MAG: helix-turn-helix domain-containing protein [Gammaproteobacteria bacterium]
MIAQRKKRGLTQSDLANLSGVSREVIAKIETGQVRQPRLLAELAEALGVTASWLQFGEAPLTPAERQFLGRLRTLEPKDRRAILQLVASLASTSTR